MCVGDRIEDPPVPVAMRPTSSRVYHNRFRMCAFRGRTAWGPYDPPHAHTAQSRYCNSTVTHLRKRRARQGSKGPTLAPSHVQFFPGPRWVITDTPTYPVPIPCSFAGVYVTKPFLRPPLYRCFYFWLCPRHTLGQHMQRRNLSAFCLSVKI